MKLHLLDNGVLLLGKENPVLLDRNEAETSNDIPVHSFFVRYIHWLHLIRLCL